MKPLKKTKLLKKLFFSEIWGLSTPKNISYMWGFGSFLGVLMVIQVFSGLLLAFYYVSGSFGWYSVVEITREVENGWALRVIHGNNASFIFLLLYFHYFRGIFQSSFYLKGPWMSGWLIKVLVMASAFLGYVLPWGQMSFWGATVIINLMSILPKGKLLVIWLWGGFYVSAFTCSFFYALHFLLPLMTLTLAGVHLLLLHFTGSSLPGGLSRFRGLSMKFCHLFSYKDMVNFCLLWILWSFMLFSPDWSADPVNFIFSDLSNSPLHIQPEWYFLHYYAILRSIPNKLGGLIGFAAALMIILTLSFVHGMQALTQFNFFNFLVWNFFWMNFMLMWLGMQPVEDPYVFLGQVSAIFYFLFFFIVLFLDSSNHEQLI